MRKGITKDGKTVRLEYPIKDPTGKRKYVVYRASDKRDKETGLPVVIEVRFGDPTMSIKNDDPGRVNSFWARHGCSQKTDKNSPGYWSCYTPQNHGARLGMKGGNSRW